MNSKEFNEIVRKSESSKIKIIAPTRVGHHISLNEKELKDGIDMIQTMIKEEHSKL